MAYDRVVDGIKLDNQLKKIANVIREKRKNNVVLNFYEGDYEREISEITSKKETVGSAIPKSTAQTILPLEGETFSSFELAAIPYREEDNTSGGKTIIIGSEANGQQ